MDCSRAIIGACIEVHKTLGPGLLESVYRECMIIEMRREYLRVDYDFTEDQELFFLQERALVTS